MRPYGLLVVPHSATSRKTPSKRARFCAIQPSCTERLDVASTATTEREARSDRHAAIEVSCGWNAEEVSCGGSSCNLYARCWEHNGMFKTTQSSPLVYYTPPYGTKVQGKSRRVALGLPNGCHSWVGVSSVHSGIRLWR